jgi:hypothetical protein
LKSILEERREERWYVWYRTIDEEERKRNCFFEVEAISSIS